MALWTNKKKKHNLKNQPYNEPFYQDRSEHNVPDNVGITFWLTCVNAASADGGTVSD